VERAVEADLAQDPRGEAPEDLGDDVSHDQDGKRPE
jgi:hypothetical protein